LKHRDDQNDIEGAKNNSQYGKQKKQNQSAFYFWCIVENAEEGLHQLKVVQPVADIPPQS